MRRQAELVQGQQVPGLKPQAPKLVLALPITRCRPVAETVEKLVALAMRHLAVAIRLVTAVAAYQAEVGPPKLRVAKDRVAVKRPKETQALLRRKVAVSPLERVLAAKARTVDRPREVRRGAGTSGSGASVADAEDSGSSATTPGGASDKGGSRSAGETAAIAGTISDASSAAGSGVEKAVEDE